MAAIISDKFRIFNAQQFLESLSEGADDLSAERTRMYFFVGRPQRWDAYVEIYNANATPFVVGNQIYAYPPGTTGSAATFAGATFKATIREVFENTLLVHTVGPAVTSAPATGAIVKAWNGAADTGAQALSGVYRFSTEEIPPVPLDNQKEKFDIYDDLVAAKRISAEFARTVIRRYNWDLVANPKYDMWKPDYSTTPASGGQIGKTAATGATSISDAKFYVINSNYEVFKCLYNGENPANTSGQNATHEPKKGPSPGQGVYTVATGIFAEDSGGKYIWKYMYTIPTDDVLRFLSTDFMPIVSSTEATRVATQQAAVNGSVNVALIENAGANLPDGIRYAPILGDGTGGKVTITISGGIITSALVSAVGSNYTYASVALKTGTGTGATAYGLFSDEALSASVTVGATGVGAVEPIVSPQGGHGSNMEMELNGKRVMTNIRLTYAEGSGDFPVDNDFRRIGIIKDPFNYGTTTFATLTTLNGVYAARISGATAGFIQDETITQTVTGGTAKGTVVSWTVDSGVGAVAGSGVLKYIQSPDYHTDKGNVRKFDGGNAIIGQVSLASGTVVTGFNSALLGATFAAGLANPEIQNNSGDIIYIENRRLITRAPDQIEDIKLVIEF